MEPERRKSKRQISTELEDYFAKLFEDKQIGQAETDILARATDAINHFSGNALTQLVIIRSGRAQYKDCIEDLPQTTHEYKERFVTGLSGISVKQLAARSQVAADEFQRIKSKAIEGNWNNLPFLRELLDDCVKYTYVIYDYAILPTDQRK